MTIAILAIVISLGSIIVSGISIYLEWRWR